MIFREIIHRLRQDAAIVIRRRLEIASLLSVFVVMERTIAQIAEEARIERRIGIIIDDPAEKKKTRSIKYFF